MWPEEGNRNLSEPHRGSLHRPAALSTCCWRTQQTLREVEGRGEEPYEAGAEAQLTVGIRIQTETRVRIPSVTRVGG